MISNRLFWNLQSWLLATALAIAVGAAYAVAIGGNSWVGVSNGLIFGGGIAALEIFVLESPHGRVLRQFGLLPLIAGTTVLWAALVLGTLELSREVFGHPWGAAPGGHPHNSIVQDTAFAFAVGFLVSFLARLQSLVGTRMLLYFLIGRYGRPVREEKVVLIVDLADSTALAERLGDIEVQSLIGQFFLDASECIVEHDGEIHQYIGDALVATWPFETGIRQANCVKSVLRLREQIRRRGNSYLERFGTAPEFRAGLHCGPVVVAEVGDVRRSVAYFGDTMNTTARLEQNCRALGCEFLISENLYAMLDLPANIAVQDMGEIDLAGKARTVRAYAIRPT